MYYIRNYILKQIILKKHTLKIESEKVLRYCEGKSTLDERIEIEKEARHSVDLRRAIHDLQISLALSKDIKELESIDTNAAFARMKKRIRKQRIQRINLQLMRYAALLFIPLLITSLVLSYLHFGASSHEMQYAEVNTSSGAIIRYELPDKSVVWLNSGSKLRYPITFKEGKREVELSGEGYFEVTADKNNPFFVKTPIGLSVYVYGTRFNINAYDDENCVETVLEQGKVNVIVPGKRQEIKLIPGEGAVYDKSTHCISKSAMDIYEKTAWKDGKLIFRNTPLKDVLKRLSRHFNVDIEFNNFSGEEYKYRATFSRENLNQILDYLSKSAAIKWKSEGPVQQQDDTFTKERITVTLY